MNPDSTSPLVDWKVSLIFVLQSKVSVCLSDNVCSQSHAAVDLIYSRDILDLILYVGPIFNAK